MNERTPPRSPLRAVGAAILVLAVPISAAPVERFLESAEATRDLPADARAMMRESWAHCSDCDGGEFLLQALTLLSTDFRAGMEAYDDDRFEDAAARFGALRGDANPFLAVNAAIMEIKALVNLERLSVAGERIEQLRTQRGPALDEFTYLTAELEFLRAYCLVADQRFEEAFDVLEAFLRDRTDVSPRLSIAAQQMLAELANRLPGRMGEVVDLMQYSSRRLREGDSGEELQGRQQRIVELLDRLIEEAEEKESSCQKNAGAGGGGGDGGGQQQGGSPQSPMPQSMLPGGGSAEQMLREGRRANPGEMWGAMPPAERERVLQALRESFPGRYRQLVEQYYEELAKKP